MGARGRAGSPTETGFQPHLGSHLPSALSCTVFRHFFPPLRQQCHVCVWAVLACVPASYPLVSNTTDVSAAPAATAATAAPPAPPDVPLELLQLARADAAHVEELEAS